MSCLTGRKSNGSVEICIPQCGASLPRELRRAHRRRRIRWLGPNRDPQSGSLSTGRNGRGPRGVGARAGGCGRVAGSVAPGRHARSYQSTATPRSGRWAGRPDHVSAGRSAARAARHLSGVRQPIEHVESVLSILCYRLGGHCRISLRTISCRALGAGASGVRGSLRADWRVSRPRRRQPAVFRARPRNGPYPGHAADGDRRSRRQTLGQRPATRGRRQPQ